MSEIWAPVFTPTLEEFSNFTKYLESIESRCSLGICKIIPPSEWSKQFDYKNVNEVCIPTPIKQYVNGDQGVYQLMLVEGKRLSVAEFKEIADRDAPTKEHSVADKESLFWKTVRFNPPIYGADMEGSLMGENVKYWNLNNLGSILGALGDIELPGITTPYLYFGMWKAMFAWHVEDQNLFSINYLHFGAPKSWYAVAPEHGKLLEQVAQSYFPDLHKACPEFLRHKTTLLSPKVISKHNIPYSRVVQKEGEIVITFPYSYHCGFNHGFNCAESVNFALESWIPFGCAAKLCNCRADSLSIDMNMFLEDLKAWKADPHRDLPTRSHPPKLMSEFEEFRGESEAEIDEFVASEEEWCSSRKKKKANVKSPKKSPSSTKKRSPTSAKSKISSQRDAKDLRCVERTEEIVEGIMLEVNSQKEANDPQSELKREMEEVKTEEEKVGEEEDKTEQEEEPKDMENDTISPEVTEDEDFEERWFIHSSSTPILPRKRKPVPTLKIIESDLPRLYRKDRTWSESGSEEEEGLDKDDTEYFQSQHQRKIVMRERKFLDSPEDYRRRKKRSSRKKIVSQEDEKKLIEAMKEFKGIPDAPTRHALAQEIGWTAVGVYNWSRRKFPEVFGANDN